jgi:GNAT superfamily N-acetyltransferase
VKIQQIDVYDDTQIRDVFHVFSAGVRFGRDEAPIWHEHEFIGAHRSPDVGEIQEVFLAVDDDGTPAGSLTVYVPMLDNVDKIYADLVVHPDHRGRGVGAALAVQYEERARSHGRSQLLVNSKLPFGELETHAYRRFAAAQGYELANIEVVRQQRLPVPDGDLDAWTAKAAVKSAGYEIRTYVDEFPADLAPSLCTLMGQLAVDAPTGQIDFEEEVMTPERLQQRYDLNKAMDRSIFETVAIKDGVVAAQTTLSVPREKPDAFQWGTFVHRDHRGHRLGLAVKAANQRAMQAAAPHLRRVVTQNGETNEWMIAINEMMGFKPFEAVCEFAKRV